jgi:hypothetical protein
MVNGQFRKTRVKAKLRFEIDIFLWIPFSTPPLNSFTPGPPEMQGQAVYILPQNRADHAFKVV